jgi:hypothetical protein
MPLIAPNRHAGPRRLARRSFQDEMVRMQRRHCERAHGVTRKKAGNDVPAFFVILLVCAEKK